MVCVHAGFGRTRLIGMVLLAAATLLAFQDIVENQVNARRTHANAGTHDENMQSVDQSEREERGGIGFWNEHDQRIGNTSYGISRSDKPCSGK